MRKYISLMTWVIAMLVGTACEEKAPDSYIPALQVHPATEITRNSACIRGSITLTGSHTDLRELRFRYGTDESMEHAIECPVAQAQPTATLESLKANTTYYYSLEAGNGYNRIQSKPEKFTTLPNTSPVLGELTLINKGPISITLQCELNDNGGELLTQAGFRCVAADGQITELEIDQPNVSTLYGRIGGLKAEEQYTVYAYARNAVGEIQSNQLTFRTTQSVLISAPGTLNQVIGEEDKYMFSKLEIVGPINGTDIRLIRDMLGIGLEGTVTPGKLRELNLTDATICEGGLSYNGSHYTQNFVIGHEMFANCLHLNKLALPNNCTTIEHGAINHCPLLTTLFIPAKVAHIEPSLNCPQLHMLEVPGNNPYLRSEQGVLYTKEGSELVWFPEGKMEINWLPGVKTIGKYAFRNCRLTTIHIPHTVSHIAQAAFYDAHFQELTLPDQLTTLPSGLFQSCKALHTLVLSKKTGYIDNYAFEGCPLKHLYVQTDIFPPHCQEHTFQDNHYQTCILHVPASSANRYQNAPYWCNFQHIQVSDAAQL